MHSTPGREAIATALLFAVAAAGAQTIEDRDTLYAPHRDDRGRFFTPWAGERPGMLRMLQWTFSRSAYAGVEAPPVPTVENDGTYLADPSQPESLTWVGHSTYVGHDGGDVFVTDPHFGRRALLPARLTEPGLPLSSIPPDAFAVISHNHYDHLDASTVDRLPASVGWYVPLGLADWFRDRGREDVTELDWWESAERGQWKITCLPSQHWSLRIGQAQNASLWCAWLLESRRRRYFFAGDTGYFHGFREFGERYPGIDAAMLPIGAYSPRWFMRYQHMDPAEAYRAFGELGAEHFLAMHWGTFDLTDEPPGYPPVEFREVVERAGGDPGRFHVPAVGERFVLPPRPTPSREPASAGGPTKVPKTP